MKAPFLEHVHRAIEEIDVRIANGVELDVASRAARERPKTDRRSIIGCHGKDDFKAPSERSAIAVRPDEIPTLY